MKLESLVRLISRKDNKVRGLSGFDVGRQPFVMKVIIPRKENFCKDNEGNLSWPKWGRRYPFLYRKYFIRYDQF
jgi:hypothetical protein